MKKLEYKLSRANEYPSCTMTFEQWNRRPVYVAQVKAYSFVCYAATLGAISWENANRMHMCKLPFRASHLPEPTPDGIAWHIEKVQPARAFAARLLKQWRAAR